MFWYINHSVGLFGIKEENGGLTRKRGKSFKEEKLKLSVELEFILAKCKTKATFSATLKKVRQLDLKAIEKQFEVVLDTPLLLVVKVDGVEIIIHGYGELLFKSGEDMVWMEKVAKKIYEQGLKRS